ncbi:MAG: hypothetical protein AMXMBFR36_21440 [Acidobacteriota bacterium]
MEQLLVELQPAIEEARRTYSAARARFEAGLPEGSHFFVTTRLRDSRGAIEQVFVRVDAYRESTAVGRIWSEIVGVQGYERGEVLLVVESEVIDWTILDAEGKEEGNFVGKLYDRLHGISH